MQKNPPVKDLKDLIAWQVAVELAVEIYRATRGFPKEETFGLRLQVRKASVSVASNIAEGHGRVSRREYLRFVMMARASLKELETQIIIATRLEFLESSVAAKLDATCNHLNRLITGLSQSLRRGKEAA